LLRNGAKSRTFFAKSTYQINKINFNKRIKNKHFFSINQEVSCGRLFVCTIQKMTSVFMETLNLFITVSKIVGLMNFCCTMESGLLYRNTKSLYCIFQECLRTFVYLIFSYHLIFNMGIFYIHVHFNLIKYWAIVITARISEKWIIKYE